MFEPPENKSSIYPTTRWTEIIDVIQKGGDDESFAALSKLFEAYKPAIHAFFERLTGARADDLTSAFFERCVIEPWNRRHGAFSGLYSSDDIRGLEFIAEALKQRSQPLTDYLWGRLRKPTQESLSNFPPHRDSVADLRSKLVADLNEILQGPCIYEEQRFADVKLSAESRNLLQRQPIGNWLIWLNRSLLADAFPKQLIRGAGFIYIADRREQAKFRSFLAHTMWWFLKDTTKGDVARHVVGKENSKSLEELREHGIEISDSAEQAFGQVLDQQFARRVFALACERIRYSKQLEDHLRGRISQKLAAEQLGLSENAFKQSYLRFRRRLAAALHEELTNIVGPNETEVEAELNYLMNILEKQP